MKGIGLERMGEEEVAVVEAVMVGFEERVGVGVAGFVMGGRLAVRWWGID